MDAYTILRNEALQKCNAACNAARAECRETLKRISGLRRDLKRKGPSAPAPDSLLKLLCEVMPHDRLFTIPEAVELMRKAQPSREINPLSVRTSFQKLEKRGLGRRVRRGEKFVEWAAADYVVPVDPFGVTIMADVAADILKDAGPLLVTELLVAMQCQGYRPDADPRMLLSNLRIALKRDERFRQEQGRKWALAQN